METVTCVHEEKIKEAGDGIKVGTCRHCGQQVQYDAKNPRDIPRVITLGRVDGKLVMPNSAFTNSLSEEDNEALASASPGGPPPAPERQMRRKLHHRRTAASRDPFKDAIIKDYRELTLKDFLRKWHLSPATWGKLKKRWGVERKRQVKRAKSEQGPEALPDRAAAAPPGNKSLPPFPPFDSNWTEATQLEWLSVYRDITLARK